MGAAILVQQSIQYTLGSETIIFQRKVKQPGGTDMISPLHDTNGVQSTRTELMGDIEVE